MRRRRRRLPRLLLNAATAVSLVLCVATACLWARSHRQWDELSIAMASGLVRVDSAAGSLHVQLISQWPGRNGLEHRSHPSGLGYPPSIILGEVVTHGADVACWDPPVGALSDNAGTMWIERLPDAAADPPRSGRRYRRIPYRYWRIPHPAAVAGLLVIAVVFQAVPAVGRCVRARRVVAGRCPACGYDLRATPDRCPECGTVPTAAPPAG